jgi:hypothetical protein
MAAVPAAVNADPNAGWIDVPAAPAPVQSQDSGWVDVPASSSNKPTSDNLTPNANMPYPLPKDGGGGGAEGDRLDRLWQGFKETGDPRVWWEGLKHLYNNPQQALEALQSMPSPWSTPEEFSQQAGGDPWRAAGRVAGFAWPEVVGAGVGGGASLVSKLPRASRAATALEEVDQAAGHLPVDVNNPGQVALNAQKFAKSGSSLPKVIKDYLTRVTDPNQPPLTFSEARDFYTNATRVSANEAGRLAPPMWKRVNDFRDALHSSLQKTAEQVGMGDAYSQGIKEYSQAMKLRGMWNKAKPLLWKTAAGAASLEGAHRIWELLNKAKGGSIVDRYPSRDSILASLREPR